MQVQSDPFLGWTHIGGRDYLVRQLNDHKGSIDLRIWPAAACRPLPRSAASCWPAATPAPAIPLVLAGYIGSGDGFAEALAKFGSLYADQTEKDWQDLRRTAKTGKKR